MTITAAQPAPSPDHPEAAALLAHYRTRAHVAELAVDDHAASIGRVLETLRDFEAAAPQMSGRTVLLLEQVRDALVPPTPRTARSPEEHGTAIAADLDRLVDLAGLAMAAGPANRKLLNARLGTLEHVIARLRPCQRGRVLQLAAMRLSVRRRSA